MNDRESDLPIPARIWLLFVRHKKLTDYDIEQLLADVNPNSIRSARLSIERRGWIRKTEEKRMMEGRGMYTVFEVDQKD